MLRRAALVAFALALPPALTLTAHGISRDAEASVSVSVSLDQLVERSSYAAIGKPVDRKFAWEEFGGQRRIVTYTKVEFERAAFGAAPRSAWVRTLGGAIGRVGQSVSGEARLTMGQRALFFLADDGGITVVVARAQGHFVIAADETVGPSPDVGGIVRRAGPILSAHEILVGKKLDAAVAAVTDAKARHDRR